MVNEILNSEDCVDKTHSFQSRGDVAVYYLDISEKLREIIKVKKFNADKIKVKFSIRHKIADSFFYLKTGEKSQLKDKWILVETKGEKIKNAIEQLKQTLLHLFEDTNSARCGRIVTKNVPNLLSIKEQKLYDNLQKEFVARRGNLRRGNRIMREEIISIVESEIH